jgi:sortase A
MVMTATRRRRSTVGVAVLAFLAETLVAAGAFVGLYALYEVWWTPLVATRQADGVVADVVGGWDRVDDGDGDGDGAHGQGEPPRAAIPTGAARYDAHAGVIGVLHVPRFEAGWARAVYEGTTRAKTLNPLGIGHYEGAAGPGEVGNFSLAGHRTTYSQPFHLVHTLEVGDALVFESADTWYVYEVTVAHLVIRPSQDEVLAPVFGDTTWSETPTVRGITLTSCHPMYSRAQRYVVHGELDYWMPKANGVPPEVTG